jgi:hypothetical protein
VCACQLLLMHALRLRPWHAHTRRRTLKLTTARPSGGCRRTGRTAGWTGTAASS